MGGMAAVVTLILLPCAVGLAAQPAAPVPAPPPAFPVEVKLAPVVTERAGEVTVGDRVEAILKREMAAEISALIAFAAVRNHDRVGAALLSDGLDLFLAPQRRRTHVLRLVREVLERPA